MSGSFFQHNPGPSIPLRQPHKDPGRGIRAFGCFLEPICRELARQYITNMWQVLLGLQGGLLDLSHSLGLDDLAKGWAAPAASLVGQVAWNMGEEILDWLSACGLGGQPSLGHVSSLGGSLASHPPGLGQEVPSGKVWSPCVWAALMGQGVMLMLMQASHPVFWEELLLTLLRLISASGQLCRLWELTC